VSIWEEEEAEDGGAQWECVTALEGHENECKSVAFSHDGALLASCSRDRSVWVWEGESRQRRGEEKGLADARYSAARRRL
jgi:WD40 repeat protein